MTNTQALSTKITTLCAERGITLAAAESCTGGLLSAAFTAQSGASAVFLEGVVAYSNNAKITRLGVSPATIAQYGAVSAQTAGEMARGIAALSGATLSVATTGIAGPTGGTPEKPVGLVYISVYCNEQIHTEELRFSGERAEIQARTVESALEMIQRIIT